MFAGELMSAPGTPNWDEAAAQLAAEIAVEAAITNWRPAGDATTAPAGSSPAPAASREESQAHTLLHRVGAALDILATDDTVTAVETLNVIRSLVDIHSAATPPDGDDTTAAEATQLYEKAGIQNGRG